MSCTCRSHRPIARRARLQQCKVPSTDVDEKRRGPHEAREQCLSCARWLAVSYVPGNGASPDVVGRNRLKAAWITYVIDTGLAESAERGQIADENGPAMEVPETEDPGDMPEVEGGGGYTQSEVY